MGIPLYNRSNTCLFSGNRGFLPLRCSEPYQYRYVSGSRVDAYDLVVLKIQEKELKFLTRTDLSQKGVSLLFTNVKIKGYTFLLMPL